MNPRERILMIATLSLGVVFGGSAGYKKYNEVLKDLDGDITKAEKKLDKTEGDVQAARKGTRRYRDIARKTLSTRPDEVKNILRDELYGMVERAGFKEPEVRPYSTELSFGKHGVKRYTCKVEALATVDQVVRFLYDLETQPYLLRVTGMGLRPQNREKSPGVMELDLNVETLILPGTDLVKASELKPQPLKDIEQRKAVTDDLRFETVDNYVAAFNEELFEPYKPPLPEAIVSGKPANSEAFSMPGPQVLEWEPASGAARYELYVAAGRPPSQADRKPLPKPDETFWRPPGNFFRPGLTYYWRVDAVNESGTTPGQNLTFRISAPDKPTEPTTVVERPEPPPADQNMVLGRIWSGAMGQMIVLEDPVNKAAPDTRKYIGDEVYGGKLIFVHPKGAVTQNKKRGRLFHPIGEPLKNNRPLTQADQPVVFEALQKLERQLEGISRRSGMEG